MPGRSIEDGMTRRDFVRHTAAGCALMVVGCGAGRGGTRPATASAKEPAVAGPIALPPLPWAGEALEPHISARTVEFHHGKHHRGYVDKVNGAIGGTELASSSLEEIIEVTAGDPQRASLFNSAAQAWNHAFYWNSIKPGGGGVPPGRLAELIDDSFGGLDGFQEEFSTAAAAQFGSGWAWLVLEGEKLVVEKTPNADTPLAHGRRPLMTIDVWEHAYYLDYQNRRKDYIRAWLDHLVNWDFAANNLP